MIECIEKVITLRKYAVNSFDYFDKLVSVLKSSTISKEELKNEIEALQWFTNRLGGTGHEFYTFKAIDDLLWSKLRRLEGNNKFADWCITEYFPESFEDAVKGKHTFKIH